MGRRDDDELTAAAEAAEDMMLRQLLHRQGQPTFVAPPPELAMRVLNRLPTLPPSAVAAMARRKRRRLIAGAGVALVGFLLLLSLGFWGVLGDSSGPALLLGDVTSGIGRVLLVLTLAAKPLVNTLLAPGLPLLLVFVVLLGVATWGWWRLVQQSLGSSDPSTLRS